MRWGGSEQHLVFVEVPEGMTPTDENAQTVEGNAANGLTEGKTFVVVEVDAADIEAGGGTSRAPRHWCLERGELARRCNSRGVLRRGVGAMVGCVVHASQRGALALLASLTQVGWLAQT